EESPAQIIRNVRSIGIDLEPAVTEQCLHFHAVRPTLAGLELHLATIIDQIGRIKPSVVIIDPITSLITQGFNNEVRALFTRLIDFCKQHGITLLLTSLSAMGQDPEGTDIGVSSLVDTWLLVRNLEMHGKRNRGLYILKSRGMAHSNQIRKLVLSSEGISLIEIPSSSLQLSS
ncbi:MAG: KaiC 1, partial [Chloroflexia bacterium]|nr:KaiC 1 [Chloroflexia bacterium]